MAPRIVAVAGASIAVASLAIAAVSGAPFAGDSLAGTAGLLAVIEGGLVMITVLAMMLSS